MDNWLRLSDIAVMTQGELHGEDVYVAGISTDTRKLSPGDLFVALQGERYDGHTFVDQSLGRLVKGAIVHKETQADLPLIKVDDTLKALSRWSNAWRKKVNPKLVGITGSNGKTTVKQMISSILSQDGCVCATQGNSVSYTHLTLPTNREV